MNRYNIDVDLNGVHDHSASVATDTRGRGIFLSSMRADTTHVELPVINGGAVFYRRDQIDRAEVRPMPKEDK